MGLRGHKAVAASGEDRVRVLVALLGPTRLAFPAHWVRGIITLAEAGREHQITWAHSTYQNTDLAGRLALGIQQTSAESRVILYGNDQRSRWFMVDEVMGLVDVNRSQVQPLPPQFRGGERERLLGLFVNETYVALIANPFWVLDLPPRKNVLDAFLLQTSERYLGRIESTGDSASAAREQVALAGVFPVN